MTTSEFNNEIKELTKDGRLTIAVFIDKTVTTVMHLDSNGKVTVTNEYLYEVNCSKTDKYFNRCFNMTTDYVPVIRNSFRKLFRRFVLISNVYTDNGNYVFFIKMVDDTGNILITVNGKDINIDAVLEAVKEIHNFTVSNGYKGSDMINKIEIIKELQNG